MAHSHEGENIYPMTRREELETDANYHRFFAACSDLDPMTRDHHRREARKIAELAKLETLY